jgi:hypothetical protein
MLLPDTHEISTGLRDCVFSLMQPDEFSIVARSDVMITSFGQRLFNKHSQHEHLYTFISTKMRELARFLVTARRLDSSVIWLADCMVPGKFDCVIAAVRTLCGHTSSLNTFKTPSLALKIGHSLKKCASIAICECIKLNNEERRKQLEAFQYLCKKEWTAEVSSAALSTLSAAHMNKPMLFPLAEDIQKLNGFLNSESARLQSELQSSPSSETWSELAKVTLTATVLFNRRRGGEAERMLVKDYMSRNKNPLASTVIAACLSETEKVLCRLMTRVEIRGTRGRIVPVILTTTLQNAIDILIDKRSTCNVRETNPYLFARPLADTPNRASDCLRKYAEKCGAACPSTLTSTRLRKHIATVSQVLNLREHELDILAGFLGHDIRVHRNFYRLPQDALQLAKVSKVLLAFENGEVSSYKGKSLDEIDVNVEAASCDESSKDSASDAASDVEPVVESASIPGNNSAIFFVMSF